MKKVFLLTAVALMSASAFVSCGPSEEERKKMEDSLAKVLTEGFAKMDDAMKSMDSTAAAVTDSAAAATTTTEETK